MEFPKFNQTPTSNFEGVPSFVEDEQYVSAFGIQWLKHSTTQLDSHTGLTITKDRLVRMFGPLYKELENSNVLEAGCGAGRFTEILIETGSLITAVDLSVAVASNQENNGRNKNLRIVRASITALPFDSEQFDIVFCPGVVQHTPNPSTTIFELYKNVKPGGWLIFDQYRYNLSSLLRSAWVVRLLLKRLSPERGLRATDWLVKVFLPAHKRIAGSRFLEILLFRFSPITSHYSGYPQMPDDDQVAWARLATHDNLTDFHKHHTSRASLKRQLDALGALNLYFCIMPYTIEVRCQKPALTQSQLESEPAVVFRPKRSTVVSG